MMDKSLIEINQLSDINNFISDFKNLSETFGELKTVKRLRVYFKNGYSLSIIQGYGTYAGKNTFEIAVLNDDELINYFDGQQVLGWQTLDDIKKVMFEISMLPEKQEMEKYNERY